MKISTTIFVGCVVYIACWILIGVLIHSIINEPNKITLDLSETYSSQGVAYHDSDGNVEWTPDMERIVKTFFGRDRKCTFRKTGFTCNAI